MKQCREKGFPLSDIMIQEKAKMLAEMFGGEYNSFTATSE